MTLERGAFTFSLDFELAWGSRDLVADPSPLLRAARVTRAHVLGPLLSLLQDRGMVATWATVGHLFLSEGRRVDGRWHPDVVPPTHAWSRGGWWDGLPEGTEEEHPEYYGRSWVERLRDAGQEVGSHSFSHPIFGDPGCSREAADSDLRRCVTAAGALGIELRSFVFPRNVPGHVDLLAAHGFRVWRPDETVWYRRRPVPESIGRIGHLLDVAKAGRPPTVLPVRGAHGLIELPASATFLPVDGVRRLIPMSRRVHRCVAGLDAAARDRRVFHLYTHPINLASNPAALLRAFGAVLDHAARLRDAGRLDVRPMGSFAPEGPPAPVASSG